MAQEQNNLFVEIALEKALLTQEQVTACRADQAKLAEIGYSRTVAQIARDKGFLTVRQTGEIRREMTKRGVLPKLGGYELIAKLGEGGMGAVYKARQISLDRIVAVKVLPAQLSRNREYIARFRREARLAGKIAHPNVVQVLDVGEDADRHYIAMEFVDGSDTAALIREGRIEEKRALEIIRGVARALVVAHEKGIVHRDIKPANIMLASDGTPKLSDLGIAKQTGTKGATLTRTGAAMGTPQYMSPEQCQGVREIDGRSDIYSLGATLYHMVCGKVPFGGATPPAVMHNHVYEPLPDPKALNADLSDGATALIRRMMEKDREARFQTCAELIEVIEEISRGGLAAAPSPPQPAEEEDTGPPLLDKMDAVAWASRVEIQPSAEAPMAPPPAPPPSKAHIRVRPTLLGAGILAFALLIVGAVVTLLAVLSGRRTMPTPSEAPFPTLSPAPSAPEHERRAPSEPKPTAEEALARQKAPEETRRQAALKDQYDVKLAAATVLVDENKWADALLAWAELRYLGQKLTEKPSSYAEIPGRIAEAKTALEKAKGSAAAKPTPAPSPGLPAPHAAPAKAPQGGHPPKAKRVEPATATDIRVLSRESLLKMEQSWLSVFYDPLKNKSCLKRAYLFRGQYCGPSSFSVRSGDSLVVAGEHTTATLWWHRPVGHSFAVRTDFKIRSGLPGVWLSGPGYGNSTELGYFFGFSGHRRSISLEREGRTVATFTLRRPMQIGRWHRLDILKAESLFLVCIDRVVIGEWRDGNPLKGPLHSFVGLGALGGAPSKGGIGYRAFSLRLPSVEIKRLAGLRIDRQLDPLSTAPAQKNGRRIFSDDFSRDARSNWWVAAHPRAVRKRDKSLMLHGRNGVPRLWRRKPVRGDFALECVISYLPGCEALNFSIMFSFGRPSNPQKDLFRGWFLAFPSGDGNTQLRWHEAQGLRKVQLIAKRAYFAPVNERSYVLRVEKKGKGVRVFSNGRFLLAATSPGGASPGSPVYIGMGQFYGGSLVRQVAAWELSGSESASGTKGRHSSPPRSRRPRRKRRRVRTPKQLHAALKYVNRSYTGKGRFTVREAKIVEVSIVGCNVTDLSPLRGLPIRRVDCRRNNIRDLSPLQGLPLRELLCNANQIADLTPLKGMQLTELDCSYNQITDLTPLKGMRLDRFSCQNNPVADLSPLKGMRLTFLSCCSTQVTDLSPLKGMPLGTLWCVLTPIADLSPVRGMPLKSLRCGHTRITDLTPLGSIRLKDFHPPPKRLLSRKSRRIVQQIAAQGCKITW